jgi:hypothetical protein
MLGPCRPYLVGRPRRLRQGVTASGSGHEPTGVSGPPPSHPRYLSEAFAGFMPVDFAFRKEPKIRALSRSWKGPWQDRRIRKEFELVDRALRAQGLRPGRWIFSGDDENSRWLVAIEARGRPKSGKGSRVRTFAASRVASVVFDPKVVSPRVVYHGISDWLRWRKKDKAIRRAGMYREVYTGNPWTDRSAEARTEVQVVVS